MVAGESVYGEKKISIDGEAGDKIEYRVWNPFRSKLAAAILGGVDNIHMKPGSKVLYLGAASGTTVSHVSDIVGPVSIFLVFISFIEQLANAFIHYLFIIYAIFITYSRPLLITAQILLKSNSYIKNCII